MKVIVPAADDCSGVTVNDFDHLPVPLPLCEFEEGADRSLIIHFKDIDQALMYALHLGDVYDRMRSQEEYACAGKKIRQIVASINRQADFSKLKR